MTTGRVTNIEIVTGPPEEDVGLSPANAAPVNARFYDAQPWAYFRRRLVHLALSADPDADLSSFAQRGFSVGPMTIRLDPPEDEGREPDVSPVANTRFVAAEAEVLLHHTAETLLRLVLAHAPDGAGAGPECPWLSIVRERSFSKFKRRVRSELVTHPDDIEETRDRTGVLFGLHPADDEVSARARLGEIDCYSATSPRSFSTAPPTTRQSTASCSAASGALWTFVSKIYR